MKLVGKIHSLRIPRSILGHHLHHAIRNGHVETALVSIEAGADVGIQNYLERTAAELAEQCDQKEILEAIQKR